MREVHAYTDGACSGNPGPGGWGVLLRYKGKEKIISGGEKETTNNRMELMAAIKALTALKYPCKVLLYTDSSYVHKGFSQWIKKWQQNGWKTSDKKTVKNIDLWMKFVEASAQHKVDLYWIKGHAGNQENEKVDRIARNAAVSFKNKI
ncbi:ribonuclease HI [Candidatus Liberibacter asiaticus]|uniref:ribonuclease HI n=2 Tax=Liberibacter asiaticus TaxID=34021 RepID=UPI00031E5E38|nr:ribonuclease HI [Candidatus Liberibacter asiaticus]MCU7487937.1 ribonuclease HI [Candidatus Liberibacter asiaticus]MCU7488967.1 ribonuclease HI [Candidatus Liberibacter asiaticus]MDI1494307.1 ribonuclease HI [Candidatus Liberibacter asiaticus]WCM57779.1 ribonuclease HI [Candidatus Liberibacter asiaticus]WCM58804.1 ribonuclease HI [Candidatus Liberibacter asiaticus]